jgi:glycine cleavage system transcriptional repressor
VDKNYFAIQAIGRDKPGLVAAITEVVCERFGCNIEGSAMTIVGGHFASTLIASSVEMIDELRLREGLAEDGGDLGLHVSPLGKADFSRIWRDASHEVTVETSERTGLVHKTSRVLFEQGVNITYLASSCDPDKNRCTVMLAVTLPQGTGSKELETLLQNALPDDILIDVKPAQSGVSRAS